MKNLFSLILIMVLLNSPCYAVSKITKTILKVGLCIASAYLIYDGLRYVEKDKQPVYQDIGGDFILSKFNSETGQWEEIKRIHETNIKFMGYTSRQEPNNINESILGLGVFFSMPIIFYKSDSEVRIMAKINF